MNGIHIASLNMLGIGNKPMRINKKYLYICLIVICFSLTLIALKGKEDIRYVQNINDFKTHTHTHIQNVYGLGMYIYYKHQETLFKDVPEHIVKEKLLNHDYEKLATIHTLNKAGYKHHRSFVERLYDYYGKQKTENMNDLIRELNKYAKHYDHAIFRKHNLINSDGSLTSVGRKISMIEKIADVVEREKNPISREEFGLHKMRPAKDFLETPFEKALALELSKAYPEVIQPHPLLYRLSKPRSEPICRELFI